MDAAGLHVSLRVEGEPAELPRASTCPPTGSCRRRSPTCSSTPAGVGQRASLRYGETALEVEVSDEGPRPTLSRRRSRGHGLIGMRERAALFGGELTAARKPDGGFGVCAGCR